MRKAGRIHRFLTLTAMSGAALFATAASALPGDAPIEMLTPADGASVPGSPAGIAVTFTCPVYRSADFGGGFVLFSGVSDYGVRFATGPELGTDGRLRDDLVVSRQSPPSTPNTLPAGQCAAAMTGTSSVTPGTYYWQVSRICSGCAGSYEVGATRSFVVTSSATLSVRAAGPAYAGFPVRTLITAKGLLTGTRVDVQRRVGTAWQRVTATSVVREAAEAFVVLPRGPQRIRTVATVGTATVVSPELPVTVARAAGWITRSTDDGSYRGSSPGTSSIKFRVARGGRDVRAFSAFVPMLCPGITAGQFTTQIGTALIPRAKVAPNGVFIAAATPAAGTAITVRGRLANKRVTKAVVTLSVGNCTGQRTFTARRTGR